MIDGKPCIRRSKKQKLSGCKLAALYALSCLALPWIDARPATAGAAASTSSPPQPDLPRQSLATGQVCPVIRNQLLDVLPIPGVLYGIDTMYRGTFRTTHIQEPYIIDANLPRGQGFIDQVGAAIGRVNPRVQRDTGLTPTQLAQMISIVSDCFQIDGYAFAGLVQMESTFGRAMSNPLGARGLTQMVGPGVQEVHDQLGLAGPSNARQSTSNYLNATINDCIIPQYNATLPENRRLPSWSPLATRAGERSMAAMKDDLLTDHLTALIYGATLLKVYLSSVHTPPVLPGERNCLPEASSPANPTLDLYRRALQLYNAEDCEHRSHYQQRVLDVFMPALTGG